MIKLFLSLSVTGLIISCNNQDQNTKAGSKSTKNDLVDCYRYANNNDTIVLKTIKVGDAITGILVYKLYQKEENEGERYARKEFSYQSFQRTFTLQKDVVDIDKIQAKYENGLLHLLIPKKEEAKQKPPRLIQIS